MVTYPTVDQVIAAYQARDKVTIGRWWRFLPSPETHEQQEVMAEIMIRWHNLGGWDPDTSKAVGWEAS